MLLNENWIKSPSKCSYFLRLAWVKFLHSCSQFRHVVLKRFLVFNFNFDAAHPEPPMARCRNMRSDPESVVIFPPDAACEGGSMVEVHYREVICRAAVKIICSLQSQMESCEDARHRNVLPAVTHIPLSTAHDDKEDIFPTKDGARSTRNRYGFKKVGFLLTVSPIFPPTSLMLHRIWVPRNLWGGSVSGWVTCPCKYVVHSMPLRTTHKPSSSRDLSMTLCGWRGPWMAMPARSSY